MSKLPWPTEQPTLHADGIRLRPWRADDADAVHTACQDRDIQRWTTVPVPYGPDAADALVRTVAPQQWQAHTGALFAVTSTDNSSDRDGADSADAGVLASCGLVCVDADERVAEVGYWAAPWARGRGVMRRAVRLLAEWATTEGGLDRLELYVDVENHPSRALARAIGASEEGVLRKKALHRGERRDMVLYALLA
ncbi:GNAT family N-acetyltransferase [Kineococcus sp. SYSU DK006]|uniref:GNAT family N-acetyltransferase n=1 Tax=Kineococcus sp. SYSU DK006 TaxID=3383127 RepID=UPI003D7D565C